MLRGGFSSRDAEPANICPGPDPNFVSQSRSRISGGCPERVVRTQITGRLPIPGKYTWFFF